MILDCIHMSCNQNFKAVNSSAKQVERIDKYLILSIAKFKIDNFYKKHQTIIFKQKLWNDNIKYYHTLFALDDKTINSYKPINYINNNNINSNILTQHQSKPNFISVFFSSKSLKDTMV